MRGINLRNLGRLVLAGVLLSGCSRQKAPAPSPPNGPTKPSPFASGPIWETPLRLPISDPDNGRLHFAPAEFRSAPSFTVNPGLATWDWPADAADCLQNLTLVPEDRENGIGWAWNILRALPPDERPAFLDRVLSLLPPWGWPEADPILLEPAWGAEVHATVFRRLLEAPLPIQWPRLVRIAANPHHPSKAGADALLQSYFPEIRPGDYPGYLARMEKP